MINILIAIQARSGSKRLPGKSLKMLDDKIMVGHVVHAAQKAANFLIRSEKKTTDKLSVKVCVLIPTGDELKSHFGDGDVIEGPENDVLERFRRAAVEYKPDYVVRLTGDCPLITSPIISKHVSAALSLNLDYCSNAYEDLRTYVDGFDCEVISSRALAWICENAATDYDKEHVTTLLRREKPRWANFGVVLGHLDLSDIKLSVDTIDDFNEVGKRKSALDEKNRIAKERGYSVFKF